MMLKRAIAAMLVAVAALTVMPATPGVAGAGLTVLGTADPSRDATRQGSGPSEAETPSAIEDIPVDGLLFTFAVAALIGAAGGKIFVSLSGDGS